ncbi:hypothetical protein BFC17_21785 [Alteromonas lipolytica]|uniref:Peptidase M16 C-terminal domain-containing protein n=2 Tax=Alteromonas lipolytica TaxID=1856405 RepID=A0A1E8FEE6_9ALTE|nr:hypothetical protein BFC17_21785 [Alteromonas lipolytica]
MESDRMGYLGESITQNVLDEQRAVVKNEKRQGQLGPEARIYDRFVENFYPPGHPYDHSPIGSMEDLDNATLDDVKQWFKDAYGASNAVLVLSGDITLDEAKQKVAHYFSDVPAGHPMAKIDQWLPDLDSIKRDIIYDKVPYISLKRTWPLPNNSSKDTVLMKLVSRTLAGHKNAPLNRVLVDEKQLASGVSAYVDAYDINSTFSLDIALKPSADLNEVIRLTDELMQSYFAKGPSAEELQSIYLGGEVSLLRAMESNHAIGSQLIDGYVHHGDPLFVNTQRKIISAATPQDIRKVAQKWLAKPYYEIQLLPEPETQPMASQVDRSKMPQAEAFTGKVTMPPIATATLANGMKLVVANRPSLPLIDVSLQFSTGTLADTYYHRGTASKAFSMLTNGTKNYSMSELAAQMDKLSIAVQGGAGTWGSSVNWGGLAEVMDEGFALAAEIVRHPTYPQNEFNQYLSSIDAGYSRYEMEPIRAAGKVYAKALWGADHPFGQITAKTTAKSLTLDDIRAFHDSEITPANATLYMIGDITLEQATELAERHFGDWQAGSAHPLTTIAKAPAPAARVILVDAPGTVQSSIMAGHVVTPFNKETAATEVLMDAALGGGFNSRLNMNLREDKGWAYGFGAGIDNAPHGERLFTASGTVQADKTAAAMTEIKREITEYVTSLPVTRQELERDKATLIYSVPQNYTNNGAFMGAMINADMYDLPYTRVEGTTQRLAAVTREQVIAQAKQTYLPEQMIWVVVGDLALIEDEIRALNFGPVEVWDVYGNKIR